MRCARVPQPRSPMKTGIIEARSRTPEQPRRHVSAKCVPLLGVLLRKARRTNPARRLVANYTFRGLAQLVREISLAVSTGRQAQHHPLRVSHAPFAPQRLRACPSALSAGHPDAGRSWGELSACEGSAITKQFSQQWPCQAIALTSSRRSAASKIVRRGGGGRSLPTAACSSPNTRAASTITSCMFESDLKMARDPGTETGRD